MKYKFHTDLSKFDINSIDKNVFDLHHAYFFVSLLPLDLKKQFLNLINDEARETFKCILNVEDQFVDNIEESDYILLPPFKYWDEFYTSIGKYNDYIQQCKSKYNKKTIIFFSGPEDDMTIDLDPDTFIFFRCGSFKSLHKNPVYGIPTFCKDYYTGKILDKKLSLSFCGYPKNNQFKKYFIRQLSKFRYSDFLIRDHWCDMVEYDKEMDSYSVSTPMKSKIEYINNIERNLYGVAIRGAANFSHRLNEIFMMGRIPVLFNTDCILPFENLIDYEKHTVYITKEKCLDSRCIDKLIKKHYQSHSEQELKQLQRDNRKLWETFFTVDKAYEKTLELL